MKNKKIIPVLLVAIVISMFAPQTVEAAPRQMPDGTTFDAEYYAQTYPDVAAAVGSDETALYNHYVQFGKAEGRKTYAAAATTESPVASSGNAAVGNSVTDKIMSLKTTYPDGSAWSNGSSFTTQSTYPNMKSTGTACQGFTYLVQDAVFGKTTYKRHTTGISKYIRNKVGAGNGYTIVQGNATFVPTRDSYSSNDPEWSQVMAAENDRMWIAVNADRTRIYDGTDAKINAAFEKIWSSLQPGDMICDANHAAIVLTKDDTGVTVVEGNVVINGAPGVVKWGRHISKETMRVALYDVYSCQW